MLLAAVIDLIEPPGGSLDKQLSVEIERAFCAAGGPSRKLIHDRYPTCPYCSTLAEVVAADLWRLQGIRGVGDEVAAKLAAYQQMARGGDDGEA